MAKKGKSARIERFILEYLKDLNATQAAARAGYSRKTASAQGSRLLRNVHVRERISAAREAQAARLELSSDRVLLELMRIGYADPLREAFDADGRMLPGHEIPENVRRAVASVEIEERTEGHGRDAVAYRVRKVKFWSKPEALNLLGKHLKIFTDIHEHKIQAPGVMVVPAVGSLEEWTKAVAGAQAKLKADAAS